MTMAEGGLVLSGVWYGEGCPLFSRLGGLGERRELPQRGPGQNPGRKRILAYFEGHRTLIFVLIWQNLRGTICSIVPPTPNSGGTCPPCPPVIYAHGRGFLSFSIFFFPLFPCLFPSLSPSRSGLSKKTQIHIRDWGALSPDRKRTYCKRLSVIYICRAVFVRFTLGGSEFRLAMTDRATIAGMEVAKLVSGV